MFEEVFRLYKCLNKWLYYGIIRLIFGKESAISFWISEVASGESVRMSPHFSLDKKVCKQTLSQYCESDGLVSVC